MTHVPEDVLAALALGDPEVASADHGHVRSCAVCAADVAALSHVRDALGAADLDASPDPAPSPGLWDRIAAATNDDDGRADHAGLGPAAASPLATVDRVGGAGDAGRRPSGGPDAGPQPGGPSVPTLRPRDGADTPREPARSRPWQLLAAALVCILAGLGIGWFAFAPDQPATRVVAATDLEALDGSSVLGSAQLLEQAGSTELRVSAEPMEAGSGFVEVWLINDDGERMVSLGVLDADEAVFAVPPDAVAHGYRIVDLSREQYDDEPRHSGDSIMRGTLPA